MLGSGCCHANVFTIEAKFEKTGARAASWVVKDIPGQSDQAEITKSIGKSNVRISYLVTRTKNTLPEFIIEQKVEITTEKKHAIYIWNKSRISPKTKTHLLVQSVKEIANGTVEFISDESSIEFMLTTDSGRALKK